MSERAPSSLPPPPPPPPPPALPATAAPPRAGRSTYTYTSAIRPARARDIGRIGMFIGGYFALSFTWGMWARIHAAAGALDVLVSIAFLVGALLLAAQWRGSEVDPLGVLAACASTGFALAVTLDVGGALGLDGRALFWLAVLVCLPAALATLLWYPHPLLGANVAAGTIAFVIGAPLGDGDHVVAGKATLLGFLLLGIAAAVDLRTRSRAGSLLHYVAILELVIAKGFLIDAVDPLGGLVLASLSGIELSTALLLRRRSWAISGWVTMAVAVMSMWGVDSASAALGGLGSTVAAIPILWCAVVVQRHGEQVRALLLEALPPSMAADFPE